MTACSLATIDIEGIVKILADVEMQIFGALKTPVIFLQNVMVDLIVAMGMKDVVRIYHDHNSTKYDAEPGFITINMPALYAALTAVGIENSIICSNIDNIGFRMADGLEAYVKTLRKANCPP